MPRPIRLEPRAGDVPSDLWKIREVLARILEYTPFRDGWTGVVSGSGTSTGTNTGDQDISDMPTSAQKDALDASVAPSTSNPYLTTNQLANPISFVPSEADVLAYPELKFWYDANNVTLSGSAITQFLDRGPLANHSTVQATSGKRPTLVAATLNGQPVARFAGGQCIQSPSVALTSFTILVILSEAASASSIVYEHSADANSNPGSFCATSNASTVQVNRGGVLSRKNFDVTWTGGLEPVVLTHRHGVNGTHKRHRFFISGNTQTGVVDGASTSNPGTASVNDVVNIGSRNNAASGALTGDIAAIVVFSPCLSSYKELAATRMLAQKYGVYVQ